MTPDPCPSCGANRNVVGIRHNCRPPPAAPKPVPPPKLVEGRPRLVRPAPVVKPDGPKSSTYRYRDPDKWRAYMRLYMQRYRRRAAQPKEAQT
jgi:hypothetical protein